MSTPLTARIVEEHANAFRALPLAGAAATRRRTALAALTASGLPTSRDENWKYANLRPLERLRFIPAPAAQPLAATDLPAAIPGFARYVFVDGAFAPALSAARALAEAHRLPAAGAVVIHARSNVLVHLAPAPVVVRVMTGTAALHADPAAWLAAEVSVCKHLARLGAAIVVPSEELPPGPHRVDELWMTCWAHVAVDHTAPVPRPDDPAIEGFVSGSHGRRAGKGAPEWT